jgi:glycosyltransferase involved in cell wall biosynthesis
MKILHVPYCYYPDPVGGTEIYVSALARVQRERGFHAAVAAPGVENEEYGHEGIRVFRFSGRSAMTLRELYGDGDPESATNFTAILNRYRPDILHLHARSQAVSVLLARAAKAKGIPTVFTYHTPTVTCARGGMLRWGKEVCDGEMRPERCAPCTLHGKGISVPVAAAVGRLPIVIGRMAGAARLEGGLWTALRSAELIRIRHAAVRRMLDEVDHICAVCDWVRDVLLVNGVPSEKITLSRQGVPYSVKTSAKPFLATARDRSALRLAFLGRVDAAKGLETVIDAISQVAAPNVTLDIFAVAQGEKARAGLESTKSRCAADPRIHFRPPVAAGEVVSTLRDFDALVVPSEGLETGPLVVYEAFAAGIPVIGSNLGGIAELVDDGINGILVAPGSVPEWAHAISRLAIEPGLLEKLKAGLKPVRTAEDTARDATMVYAKVSGVMPTACAARRIAV